MAGQLTLSVDQCQIQTTERRDDTSPNEENGRNGIQTLQENTVFVDSPTGPTTVINDFCNPIVSLGDNGDSRHDHTQCTELEDIGDSHPEPITSHVADDVPTDIAVGPDQTPVQPKMKFPTTLK